MIGLPRRSRALLMGLILFFIGATMYLRSENLAAATPIHTYFPHSGIQLERSEVKSRADAIREAYLHSWNGYMQFGFPKDELLPMSKRGGNSMSGWGASVIDGIGTAVLMELPEVVEQQLKFISKIDYTKCEHQISLFETTIRYLGGMISAYDLLTGPYSWFIQAGKGQKNHDLVQSLLRQSVSLADALKWSFNTSSGIPMPFFMLDSKWIKSDDINNIAGIGTLVLEWTRLSDLTGDPQYTNLAQRAQEYLLKVENPEIGEPFPGLLGTNVGLRDGRFLDSYGGWGAMGDSYYEYLIKMYVYDPQRFRRYMARWIQAADSTMTYLTSVPDTTPASNLVFVGEYSNGRSVALRGSHLACFIGGNFLLGGQVLDNMKYNIYGLKLVEGCRATYAKSQSGIGPERFGWDANLVPSNQKEFFQKNGWYFGGEIDYRLRPEVIESYYHAWIVTRDDKYRQWAWEAFEAINRTCRTEHGFTSVSDVSREDGGKKDDKQESFWFAEVLKYLFLIFNEEGIQSKENIGFVPGKKQKWVFNTEAHPIRIY
ncbi:maturation of Asn-linked oligosaccharides protein [Orbilia oligospora]|uniref:alpha-1,2-Mannosidase n=2 Tax=Orbilia oligospora TaxID=2813651 RepID=A0A7C8NXV8_ORBOL|nr:maturation of Asn-linked oligosaccharides protein [Orbilia oligospora]KAF3117620.1 maturation of Asn-linked oligosaccharides protein [Orbilia oligospora]